MSPMTITLATLAAAVAVVALSAIRHRRVICDGLWASIAVAIMAFGSLVAWWIHPLRDATISDGEGFLVVMIGAAATLIALRLRKVIIQKYGFDPVPR